MLGRALVRGLFQSAAPANGCLLGEAGACDARSLRACYAWRKPAACHALRAALPTSVFYSQAWLSLPPASYAGHFELHQLRTCSDIAPVPLLLGMLFHAVFCSPRC